MSLIGTDQERIGTGLSLIGIDQERIDTGLSLIGIDQEQIGTGLSQIGPGEVLISAMNECQERSRGLSRFGSRAQGVCNLSSA